MKDVDSPNVLLLVLDTVRARQLGLYGRSHEPMPNLASFAARDETTVFERAYANAPWTVPAHTTLFTGKLPSEHGCHGGSPRLENETTIPAELSKQGYHTYAISNNIWISDYFGFDTGFDSFYKQWQLFREAKDVGHILKTKERPRGIAETILEGNPFKNTINGIYGKYLYRRNDFGAKRTTKNVLSTVADASDPWFLFVNYMEGHAPYQPHVETREYIDESKVELRRLSKLSGRSFDYHTGALSITNSEFESLSSLYDGELRYLDKYLGRLFKGLAEQGELQDSLIIVVGDHGENIGDHDLMAHRFSVHDTVLKVPLLIHYPGGWDMPNSPATPVDLRDVATELRNVTSGAPPILGEQRGAPIIAEYISTAYTPEARDDDFDFSASRFNRRYATAITRDYKLVRDSNGGIKLYKRDGEDYEIDGSVFRDERVEKELLEACSNPQRWEQPDEATEVDKEVAKHLEALGYR